MELTTYSSAEQRAVVLGCYAHEVTNEVMWASHREVWDALPAKLPFLRRAMTLDLTVYLPGLGLAYVDRAGMEFGVEIRVPWLDLELVRWSMSLPTRLLVRRGEGKRLSRELARRHLGARVASHPKMSFGARASTLPDTTSGGGIGFRQDRYFSLAKRLLADHIEKMDVST